MGPSWAPIEGGLVILLGVGPADTPLIATDLARRVTELRIFRDDEGGRTGASSMWAAPSWRCRSSRSTRIRGAGGVRGSPARRRLTSPRSCTDSSSPHCARSTSSSRPAGSAPRWPWSSSTMARSRSGSIRTTDPGERTAPSGSCPGLKIGAGPWAGGGYLADFSWVRRQRVQTRAFTGAPFCWMTSGCRFGCMRRCARTRFIPEDWGLKPPIDALPQIAQERAMRGPLPWMVWGVRAGQARTER